MTNENDPKFNPLGLPVKKKTPRGNLKPSLKKAEDWTPRIPMFCPCRDPDTDKRCGNVMRNWDEMFFEQYGMCEECYLKYNSHKEEIAEEMERQLAEKTE